MNIQQAIHALTEHRDLSSAAMTGVMRAIMTGRATPAQIGGFLIGLRMKGETVDEIAAAVAVMRELVIPVEVDKAHLVDTCGTGGDAAGTFNISTASALVAAAAGARVAKHGNRSVSGRSGSADVLEAAGVDLSLDAGQVAVCIDQVGVGFMFAPRYHGATRHAVGPRQEMAVRTLFNLLGPMTNPAGAPSQVIGVYHKDWLLPVASALQKLGSRHVLVVHGDDGMDEISITGPTRIAELKAGVIDSYTINPEQFGIERQSLAGLCVDSAEQSLGLMQSVLAGKPGAAADIVCLNAGASLYVAGVASDLDSGVSLAREQLTSGRAAARLAALVDWTQAAGRPSSTAVRGAGILETILKRKREEIQERSARISLDAFKDWVADAPAPRPFRRALETRLASNQPAVIAEIKKASPSRGVLREHLDPRAIAYAYETAGACCLSVLTDSDFFKGSGPVLELARAACALPVLRKDFIIDPYQVYESRALGADCVLLIAAALADDLLAELHTLAVRLGMDVLIEVHDANELERALAIDTLGTAQLIGINNRDLTTFETRLETTLNLLQQIPDGHHVVTESGIHTAADVAKMRNQGVNSFLVGEAFMSADDPGERLRELFFPA